MNSTKYRIVRGKDIGQPSANWLVVDQNNKVIGNDAVSLLGFPMRKLALGWKRRLEEAATSK